MLRLADILNIILKSIGGVLFNRIISLGHFRKEVVA